MIPEALDRILMQVQKPSRYSGGEEGSVVKSPDTPLRFALCFPDLYEVGMSHLGLKILYSLLNNQPDVWCERVFAPGGDMEALLRKAGQPLYGLESLQPIAGFDVIGFTLQYEMCYTTMLNMLDLAGLPLYADQRTSLSPLIIAGGPCACNPEPLAAFVDLFCLGEGEEVTLELLQLYRTAKAEGWSKEAFLRQAAQIPGVYVPSLYRVEYKPDGTIDTITPLQDAPAVVQKRIIRKLDEAPYPQNFVVPFTEIVHNRAITEVMRGCPRGCRFCQAGFIYRPVRHKSAEVALGQALGLCDATGYDELSLISLSTSDYANLEALLTNLLPETEKRKVNLSMPSLRVDNFSPQLLEMVARVRKSGLTFAPEAGSQRMRDVINKNITEQEVLDTCRTAFAGGYTAVKLYFMLGLPTETPEDIAAITQLAQQVVECFYDMPNRPKGKSPAVTASVACFVPKPFTPFQFEPQDTLEQFNQKQRQLLDAPHSRKVKINYHDAQTSILEGVLARGDRRLAPVLEAVWRAGGNLEGWSEHFRAERWQQAFAATGVDPAFYAHRTRSYEEILPWEHLDYGISKAFLIKEHQRAQAQAISRPCFTTCEGCGANRLAKECCS